MRSCHADTVVHHVQQNFGTGVRDIDSHVPAGPVVFARVAQEIEQHLEQPAQVRDGSNAEWGERLLGQRDRLRPGKGLGEGYRFVEDGGDVSCHVRDLETPRLDAGDVHDIIAQAQQVPAGVSYEPHPLGLGRRQDP